MRCEIQWVQPGSPEPTPDTNEAIGYAICFSGEPNAFPICAEHVKHMPREGWFIVFLPITAEKLAAVVAEVAVVTDAIRKAFPAEHGKILTTLRKASDHYSFQRWGMYVGVEPDGCIHT
jgi:hypothetical protein